MKSLEVELMFYAWMLALWMGGALRYPAAVFAGWVALALGAAVSGGSVHVPWVGNYLLILDHVAWFAIGLMAYVTLRDGAVRCRATPAHLGRTTQVWDAVVTNEADGKTIALFRCTQMVLWPK